MTILDWILKITFWSWLTVFAVGIADLAIDLQSRAIGAYKKGPISAKVFTTMLLSDQKQGEPKKK